MLSIHPLLLLAIDFHSWDTYFYAGVAAGIGWLIKTAIAQGKAQVALETTVKYYVERQTADALQRLDKGNPAPTHIVKLARRRIEGKKLTELETGELITWLRWAARDDNPDIDSAERSAALQLLTGFKTGDALNRPRKRWWQF